LSGLLAMGRGEIFELEIQLQRDPDYPGLVSVRLLDLQPLQAQLPGNVAIVWYYPARNNLFVQVLTKETSQVYTVAITRDVLFNSAKTYRQLMDLAIKTALQHHQFPTVTSWQDPDIRPLLDESIKLYQYLIEPIESILTRKTTVVFVPAGVLYYLPLHALVKEGDDGSPEFVIEHWRVAYMTTTTLLTSLFSNVRTPLSPEQRFAETYVFANPDGSLPGSEREADFIETLTNKQAKIFKRESATEQQAVECASHCRLLVLTTHTLANPQRPDSTFVLLNGSTAAYDGYWHTAEIERLNFPKLDLVVLPNCETAIGEENPGGDVRNLVMAFAGGGAASVLATLWPVSDLATGAMMKEFYTKLFCIPTANCSKIQALQQAQLSLLKEPRFRHPFCWAGFILFGYWQ